jgi:hypothetical protein
MPISYALLLCIPIGLLFYLEARWLIRYLLGRYEKRERKAACLFGAFGASLVPLINCFRLIEDALPGRLGTTIASGFFMVAAMGLVGTIFAILNNGR